MENCEFYVYLHRRLSSDAPFYVGKGSGRRAQDCFSRNAHWKRIYAKDGGRTLEYIVRDVDEEFALLVEAEVIDQYRRVGIKLANITSGGDGVTGMRHSEATKAKFRARVISKETRLKMSEAQIAFGSRPFSESAKAAALAWHLANPSPFKGRSHSPETRATMVASWATRKLMPISQETRQKISIAVKGRPKSSETRAKLSAAKTGLKLSPESLALRRASMLARAAMAAESASS
jgi:hypothetical protein